MQRISVLFVCLGNICRSPMAEALFASLAAGRGLGDRFDVDSAGTGSYHTGSPPHPRTVEVLRRNGIAATSVARTVIPEDFQRFDLVLAMDGQNLRDLQRVAPASARAGVHLVLDPVGGGDVPDPYGGDLQDYVRTFDLLKPALDAWLDRLAG